MSRPPRLAAAAATMALDLLGVGHVGFTKSDRLPSATTSSATPRPVCSLMSATATSAPPRPTPGEHAADALPGAVTSATLPSSRNRSRTLTPHLQSSRDGTREILATTPRGYAPSGRVIGTRRKPQRRCRAVGCYRVPFPCQGGRINARNQKTTIGQSAKACAEVTLPLLRCACRGPRRSQGSGGPWCIQGSGGISLTLTGERPPRYVFCRGPVPPFLHAPHIFSLDTDCRACHAPLASRPLGGSPPLVARTGSRDSFLQLPMAPTTGAREARADPGGSRIRVGLTSRKIGGETKLPIVRRWRDSALRRTKLPQGRENVGATDTPMGADLDIEACGSQQVASDGTSFE